ncbi:MAG: hypothetical protein BZY88_05850 [SAR202 cluster bacterium Io17-Chloro-G9]|nr:MAG: hypothetical protein BZY88_05850 [SAR202 cluster bacterium Io17-Chloro-G9]
MDIRAPVKALTSLVCFLLMIVALSLAGGVALAQETGSSGEQGEEAGFDEAEAISIDRMIMCPVCPAETIDQAQVEIARQMRQMVREMLSRGETRDEILDFFAGNYGPDILAAPPKSGFNLLAWILPGVAVVVLLGAGLLVIRSMTVRGVTAREAEPALAAIGAQDDLPTYDLTPYLEAVDRDLGLDIGPLEGPAGQSTTGQGVSSEEPSEEGLSRDV